MGEAARTLMNEQEAMKYLGISRSSLRAYARNGIICYAHKIEVPTGSPHGGRFVIYEFYQDTVEAYDQKRHEGIINMLHAIGCKTPLLFSKKNPQRKTNVALVLDYLNHTSYSIRVIGALMGVSYEQIRLVAIEENYDLRTRRKKNQLVQRRNVSLNTG